MDATDGLQEELSVEPGSLRRTMGKFATGVAVVTTAFEGQAHGMTINSVTSVSLEPPIVLVSLAAGARTTEAVHSSGAFAISILSIRQDQLALRFAKRGEDHFEGLSLEYEEHEVPVVPGSLAHVECAVDQEIVAGDHVVFLGRVTRICDREGEPLAFYSGQFGDFAGFTREDSHWFF